MPTRCVLQRAAPGKRRGLPLDAGARGLRAGGTLLVQGYFLSEDRRAPQFTTLHNLSALALWDGGRSWTVGDMQALIAAAGFERQTVLRQESSGFACCRPRSCDAVPIPNHGANMSTLTLNNTESEVIAWLKENRNATVEGIKEKNLIEERILDSMQFLDFIMFLGELTGRDVSGAITVDDLKTVDAIVRFVHAQS